MKTQLGYGRLLPILVLAILASLVLLTPIADVSAPGEKSAFCLGFILIFAFFLAKTLSAVGLPEISGYIIAGLICGPFVLDILSYEVVRNLQVFDDVALAIIALIAGSEMRLSFLRRSKAALLSTIGAQVAFSFVGAVLVVLALAPAVDFLREMDIRTVLAVALLLGVVTAARSPSTTIGVITEMRAKGPMTNLVVGITVILDVVILVLVAIIVPAAQRLAVPGGEFSIGFAADLLVHVLGSTATGVLFGAIVGFYIRWVGEQLPIFLVGVGLIGSMFCRQYNFEPLLAFMIAGFVIQNFTVLGDKLIRGLERSALPVYVVFFAISGASIDLAALRATWVFALVLVLMRAGAFYVGSLTAGRISKVVRPHARKLWMGFLPQAGVTIGIATIIDREFEWGAEVKTVVLAVVALNQLIGPVALKFLLVRSGEARSGSRRASRTG